MMSCLAQQQTHRGQALLQVLLLLKSIPAVVLMHLALAVLTGLVCGVIAARLLEGSISPAYAAIAGAVILYPAGAMLAAARPRRED